MKILIYGINFSPEKTGIGKYTGEKTQYLAETLGHDVKVVTAPPYYPEWKIHDGFKKFFYKVQKNRDFEVTRCPIYVPQKPTTIKRLIHLWSFSLSSIPALIKYAFWKPDIVIVIAPSFFSAPFGWLTAKLTGSKSLIHIQDYELDAMFGLGMAKKGKIAKIAASLETLMLRGFDAVSSISFNMVNKAVEKGVDENKVILFPNWVDTDFITPEADRLFFRKRWNIEPTDKVILYSGNMGKKQGLELVLDAAEAIHDRPNVKFVMVGHGVHKDELESITKQKGLKNIIFKDLVEYKELPDLMAMADIHLVVQKKGAADAVLPSKLTSILSAGGHSLITAEPHTELGILSEKFPGISKCVDPENLTAFIDGLESLLNKDTTTPNTIARNYAVTYLNKASVLNQFDENLKELCGLKLSSRSM